VDQAASLGRPALQKIEENPRRKQSCEEQKKLRTGQQPKLNPPAANEQQRLAKTGSLEL
jgi:hypothetical protein